MMETKVLNQAPNGAPESADIRKKRLLSYFGLLAVAAIWGSTFPAGKYALEFMTPLYLMGIRFMMAFAVMLVLFWKKIRVTPLAEMKGGLIAGFALFGGYILQVYGLQYTTPGKQSFLAGAYVIVVPFLTWLVFKKNPSIKAYFGAALCFWGISLISLNENLTIGIGDSITLVSSALYGVHIVVTGYYARNQDAGVFSTVQIAVGGFLAMTAAIILDPVPTVTANSVGVVVYLAILGSFVAYYLQTLCQKYAKPSIASIIMSLETVFGSLLSMLLMGEIFTVKMMIGAAAILVAIWVSEL